MRPPEDLAAIIGGKRYSRKTATLLAGNDYWDGHNYERSGRNTFLYRTPRGAYFFAHLTQWIGEQDSIEPCSIDEAISFFEDQYNQHRVSYDEAFPNIKIEDA